MSRRQAKPSWWKWSARSLWLALVALLITLAAITFLAGLYLGNPIPVERAVAGVILCVLALAFAYYIRLKPSARVNRAIYILVGITPIGFLLWVASVLTVFRFLVSLLGFWLAFVLICTIPYVAGGFIGDWLGRRRNYRLPWSESGEK